MAKKISNFVFQNISQKITDYCLYALIFLFPLFFLPWTPDFLDLNKQALLLGLVFISLCAWMAKGLVSGKISINKNFITLAAGILCLSALLSTLFSINRYGSFWGASQTIQASLVSVAGLGLFYFLLSNNFSGKKTETSIFLIFLSLAIAGVYAILQIFGIFIIPFAKSIVFNSVGTIGTLGLIGAAFASLGIALSIISKSWLRVFYIICLVLSAFVLVFINYQIIWIVSAISSAVFLVFGFSKRGLIDTKWMALPVFFLALSLFFIIVPNLKLSVRAPDEVLLTMGSELKIAAESLKEKPIFGFGPGTFSYNFLRYKDPEINKTVLWNTALEKGSFRFTDILSTAGILGLLALLFFVLFPIFLAIKFILSATSLPVKNVLPDIKAEKDKEVLVLGILSALVGQAASYFVYNPGFVFDFCLFFLVATLASVLYKNVEVFDIRKKLFASLSAAVLFVAVFAASLGVLIFAGRRYTAEAMYLSSLSFWQKGDKETSLKNMETSARLNPSNDLYFRELAQGYLSMANIEISKIGKETIGADQKKKIESLIDASIKAGKIAANLNPKNFRNWANQGYVYQNLVGILNAAPEETLKSYDKAIELDPYNPYLLSQKANTLLSVALKLPGEKTEEKNKLYSESRVILEKAISLNSNYLEALYSLGIVYDLMGDKNLAIDVFSKITQLNPNDENAEKVLENLKSGKPVIEAPQPPAPTPSQESEKNKKK